VTDISYSKIQAYRYTNIKQAKYKSKKIKIKTTRAVDTEFTALASSRVQLEAHLKIP
jgi:hypothetical protein